MACSCFEIWPRVLDRRRIIHGGDFLNLLHRALAYFFGHTFVQKGGGFSEVRIVDIYLLDKLFNRSPLSLSSLVMKTMRNTVCDITKKRNQVWIPPYEEDGLRDHNLAGFRKIKKTTQTGRGLLPCNQRGQCLNTIPIDTFQIKIWATFEQLRINQDIQGMQLTKIV
ncbi:hypothetical protein M9H77_30225 [Catharanthus roseus]|uniref:Uncharacterized protein n=1 Tax=Catharanthus roseus TaxID=4058 RepID=A0ACB9ZWM8_CATRO|nr:hypothetical protein M9H77_30225 [Catharanthus roseus]